jgi:hypothetical protein
MKRRNAKRFAKAADVAPERKKAPQTARKEKLRVATNPNGEQIERVRRICLALPGSMEKPSHGEPTFFVSGRVFAMFSNNHHHDGHVAVSVPAEDGVQTELIRSEPGKFYRPPYVGVKGWVGIELAAVSDDELGLHISEAYRLIGSREKRRRR